MAKKHGPLADEEWVPLPAESVHAFDQTGGLAEDDDAGSAGTPSPTIAEVAALLRAGQSLNGGGV